MLNSLIIYHSAVHSLPLSPSMMHVTYVSGPIDTCGLSAHGSNGSFYTCFAGTYAQPEHLAYCHTLAYLLRATRSYRYEI